MAARAFYHLPYFRAEIELKDKDCGEDRFVDYSLVRTDQPAAAFHSSWKIGEKLPTSQPGSLEFFLTERYCLYSEHAGELYRARIHHAPWPLQQAELVALSSSMIESHGVPTPEAHPLLHYCEELSVDIWPLRKVCP
jgi:hypothetical protein